MDPNNDLKSLTRRTFGEAEKQYTFISNNEHTILNNTTNSTRPAIKRTIERSVINKTYKITIAGVCSMRKSHSDNEYEIYKENDYTIVHKRTFINDWIDDKFCKIGSSI